MQFLWSSVQFSSVSQSCLTLCDPMNRSMPGLPVHHQLPEFTQTHVHRVSDAIQPSHPLSSTSPPAPNPSQHQSLFQWVNSSHEVAKVLEFQLQQHSFQRNPRADLLQNGLVGSLWSHIFLLLWIVLLWTCVWVYVHVMYMFTLYVCSCCVYVHVVSMFLRTSFLFFWMFYYFARVL